MRYDILKSMKVIDVIFGLICGAVIGWLFSDFLNGWLVGWYYLLGLWVLFACTALVGLWLADLIGRKILFIYQVAKHLLVGAFATVIDLKLFELLVWLLAVSINPITAKGMSFVFSVLIKYAGNKYWAFEQHQKENWHKEALQFFFITIIGLLIDLGVFYYATNVVGAPSGINVMLWTKLSVILAAIAAAAWNFLGYKFLVFKR